MLKVSVLVVTALFLCLLGIAQYSYLLYMLYIRLLCITVCICKHTVAVRVVLPNWYLLSLLSLIFRVLYLRLLLRGSSLRMSPPSFSHFRHPQPPALKDRPPWTAPCISSSDRAGRRHSWEWIVWTPPLFFKEASHWLDQMWRTGIPPLVSWQKIVFCPLSLIQPEVLQDTITRDRVKECLHHGRWVATPFISCVITAINV